MRRCSLYIILAITSTSCATLFNTRTTNVTIVSSEQGDFVVNNDTLIKDTTSLFLSVIRNKEPLVIEVFNDSLSKTAVVKAKNSFAYWLNLYPNLHLWTGFIIDTKTKKRWTYPKTVYLDFERSDIAYLTSPPKEEFLNLYPNIFKIAPAKTLLWVNAGIELSYERRTRRNFATQATVSYLLPASILTLGDDFKQHIKGFVVALEEKFYFKPSGLSDPYLGLEFSYLDNRYHDIWSFGIADTYSDTAYQFTNYTDKFGIKKQTYSLNLKLGMQIVVNRLVFDLYAGLGLKYKDVRHFDRLNPADEMELPRHPNVWYITNKEGRYWTLNIPLSVKIGWCF